MSEIKSILTDIKNKKYKPIYFLMGEESYFIDRITDVIEKSVLTEEEKAFNQTILYGRDTSVNEIIGCAKRYPMGAEHQVILVKEAQDLSRTIEKLVDYAENPQKTTILVLCYKYKTLDKRKKLYKTVLNNGIVFESKKLYENQVSNWISGVLTENGFTISSKATLMLVEFLGTDLDKINNELEKLQLILQKGDEITPEVIEKNIGISKDFNNFELRKAIGERNVKKAVRIINYFGENPKNHPIVVTIGLLYSFFSQVLKYHGLQDKSTKNVASILRINPYFVNEYVTAARHYPMKKISSIISHLRETDVKSKGVGVTTISQGDLLKELVVKMMY